MAAAASPLPLISVLGSLNIDLVSYVPRHPAPGETLTANAFKIAPGGKGANQAVACAKLSRPRPSSSVESPDQASPVPHTPPSNAALVQVHMVGCVGPDAHGTLLRTHLSACGVDVSGVTTAAPHVSRPAADYSDDIGEATPNTGTAVIIVDQPTGQNRIILSPGANNALMPDTLDLSTLGLLPPTTTKPSLLIVQLEIPLPTVRYALVAARAAAVPTLLNPAPAPPDSLPADMYACLDHLILNETEAALLSGCREEDLVSEAGLERVAGGFLDQGVGCVVVTLGGRGVWYMQKMGKSGMVPAMKVEVRDTTAAGDTFVGAYALAVVEAERAGREFDVAAAVQRANRAAGRSVERLGGLESIPWADEVD